MNRTDLLALWRRGMPTRVESLEPRRLFSSAAPSATAEVPANTATFDDGNGKLQSDQYPGVAGNGWQSGWSSSSNAVSGSVLSGSVTTQPPPIDLTQPDYLQVTAATTGSISRGYDASVGAGGQLIQFDYRYDGTSVGTSGATSAAASPHDFLMLFGDNSARAALQRTASTKHRSNTWAVIAYTNQQQSVWEFGYTNRKGTTSYLDDTSNGLPLVMGDIYQFAIDVTIANGHGTYTATVKDTNNGGVYTSPQLKFCSNAISSDFLNFGATLAPGETARFSADAIHAAATPAATAAATPTAAPAAAPVGTPAAEPVVFVIGGYSAPQVPENGVPSVQEDYQPLFNYDGIDTSNFRWYEENYNNDSTLNPKHDTIADEIDKVPKSTPVILMGFSFGGGEAVATAAAATRPINDLILFDPVLQADYSQQITRSANGQTAQLTENLSSNVEAAVDISRDIFQSNGTIYPSGPYGFRINDASDKYENLTLPHSADHDYGEVTPREGTAALGDPGDAINDTSEFVEDAMSGSSLFWDGWTSLGS